MPQSDASARIARALLRQAAGCSCTNPSHGQVRVGHQDSQEVRSTMCNQGMLPCDKLLNAESCYSKWPETQNRKNLSKTYFLNFETGLNLRCKCRCSCHSVLLLENLMQAGEIREYWQANHVLSLLNSCHVLWEGNDQLFVVCGDAEIRK